MLGTINLYCFTQIGYDYKLSGRETLRKVYVMFPTQERQLVDQRFSSLEKNNYRGQCTFIFSPALNPIKAELLRGFQKIPCWKECLKSFGQGLVSPFSWKNWAILPNCKEELSFPESQNMSLCATFQQQIFKFNIGKMLQTLHMRQDSSMHSIGKKGRQNSLAFMEPTFYCRRRLGQRRTEI